MGKTMGERHWETGLGWGAEWEKGAGKHKQPPLQAREGTREGMLGTGPRVKWAGLTSHAPSLQNAGLPPVTCPPGAGGLAWSKVLGIASGSCRPPCASSAAKPKKQGNVPQTAARTEGYGSRREERRPRRPPPLFPIHRRKGKRGNIAAAQTSGDSNSHDTMGGVVPDSSWAPGRSVPPSFGRYDRCT